MSRRQRQPSEPIAVGHRHAEIAARQAASAKHEADERRYRLNPELRPEPAPEPVAKPRRVVFAKPAATPTPPAAVEPQTSRGGGRPQPFGSSAGRGADPGGSADVAPTGPAPTSRPAVTSRTRLGGSPTRRRSEFQELDMLDLRVINAVLKNQRRGRKP